MDRTDTAAPVNSRSWWEDYFASDWDANHGRAQTASFMERLLAALPDAEREFLASRGSSILDWGCAFGNGVDVLARAFPRCRVSGMDFAVRAITEARRCFPQYDFQHTEQGEIDGRFDVIVTSNCLEHFADPLATMRQHLRSCRSFYVALVPYRESPLCASHVSQFREECFPERLDDFTRIAGVVIEADARYWRGQQILVVYGSPSYLSQRQQHIDRAAERQKWEHYYAGLSPHEMDGSVRRFGEELAAALGEFLPDGSAVLEAGCGAGWQSMILAESGKYRVALMDFAPAALQFAQRLFQARGLGAEFLCGDVFEPGAEGHDLVFNAGVLEHYTFDQQVAFLRGMASRSRKYVLALVPNRHCYWYWIWRIYQAGRGDWPYGKEAPMADLSAAFEAAGLTYLGRLFGGSAWSEDFIGQLPGLSTELREHLLTVHRSGIIPPGQQGYLLAALGCKGEVPSVPARWRMSEESGSFATDETAAALADALALNITTQQRCLRLEQQLETREKSLASLGEELRGQSSRGEELHRQVAAVQADLAAAQAELAARKVRWHLTRWLPFRKGGLARRLRKTAGKLAPADTLRGRCLRGAAGRLGKVRGRWSERSSLNLEQILAETKDRKGIVVYPPFIDWTWMRQRPHQLMMQFARAGHLSLFCSPRCRTDAFRGFQRVAERLYLCDSLDDLYDLPDVLLLVGWTGHWETVKRFRSASLIYDYLDDLGVSSAGGVPDARKLELHRKLVTKSRIVLATARRLYEEVRALRPDALYCPNGADYEHFHLTAAPPVPPDIADLVATGRPIIGYYGALARWFDYDLLAHAAAARKGWHFLLIGPDFDGTLAAAGLARLPNVRRLSEKKYEELPAYLHYFTVATIPFLVNDITRATSPVKLFEYLAAGKPIVTTDLPECRQYAGVLVAHDPAEYAATLGEAIELSRQEGYRRSLDEEARNQTWEARVRQIIARLDAMGDMYSSRSA